VRDEKSERESWRLFVAIPVPEAVKSEIEKAQEDTPHNTRIIR
jgi:2'-5' RNA ligase